MPNVEFTHTTPNSELLKLAESVTLGAIGKVEFEKLNQAEASHILNFYCETFTFLATIRDNLAEGLRNTRYNLCDRINNGDFQVSINMNRHTFGLKRPEINFNIHETVNVEFWPDWVYWKIDGNGLEKPIEVSYKLYGEGLNSFKNVMHNVQHLLSPNQVNIINSDWLNESRALHGLMIKLKEQGYTIDIL